MVSIDTSKAQRVEGVKAIISHKDVPLILIGESGCEDAYILPDKVRFVGDEVLAVAAESEEIAEQVACISPIISSIMFHVDVNLDEN